jgi:hypothetical protein
VQDTQEYQHNPEEEMEQLVQKMTTTILQNPHLTPRFVQMIAPTMELLMQNLQAMPPAPPFPTASTSASANVNMTSDIPLPPLSTSALANVDTTPDQPVPPLSTSASVSSAAQGAKVPSSAQVATRKRSIEDDTTSSLPKRPRFTGRQV